MAKDLKFQGSMMIFGTVIITFIVVYTVCCIFLTEGLTSDQTMAIQPLKPTYGRCNDLYGHTAASDTDPKSKIIKQYTSMFKAMIDNGCMKVFDTTVTPNAPTLSQGTNLDSTHVFAPTTPGEPSGKCNINSRPEFITISADLVTYMKSNPTFTRQQLNEEIGRPALLALLPKS